MLHANTEVTNFQISQREREREEKKRVGVAVLYINMYGDIYIIFILLHQLFGLGR